MELSQKLATRQTRQLFTCRPERLKGREVSTNITLIRGKSNLLLHDTGPSKQLDMVWPIFLTLRRYFEHLAKNDLHTYVISIIIRVQTVQLNIMFMIFFKYQQNSLKNCLKMCHQNDLFLWWTRCRKISDGWFDGRFQWNLRSAVGTVSARGFLCKITQSSPRWKLSWLMPRRKF